jgi:mRNA interferase RelE/StbE
MYKVELSREARRFFERAAATLQRRLDKCFDQLKANPRNAAAAKPLAGKFKGLYRYRVGDYRIIYRVDEQRRMVFVLRIAHRSEAYD